MQRAYDAVVIGAGPNGLAAAITMARAGRSVLILESQDVAGGGVRSSELTLPSFTHDICSAVYPLAVNSPFFQSLPLEQFDLEWIHSPAILAHPTDSGDTIVLNRSLEATAALLGEDEANYLNLLRPFVEKSREFFDELFRPPLHFPSHPWLMAKFATKALTSAESLSRRTFSGRRAKALFLGIAAHSSAPLHCRGTSAIGLALNIAAHVKGWPIAKGGAQRITEALLSYLYSLGGELKTGFTVESLKQLPPCRNIFFDTDPKTVSVILGAQLKPAYTKRFANFRHSDAVFKIDWALSAPIPWKSKACLSAATLHLSSDADDRPLVILVQPSLFDSTRAPAGLHTAWAYCHVPNGSKLDMTQAIEAQVERFAPGFGKIILKRSVLDPENISLKNDNFVGGDISGGEFSLRQLLLGATRGLNPYRLPIPGFYICSSSTPPGPAVHGMCGFNAAVDALRS